MGHRLPQIESTLKRAIALVLNQRLADPRVVGMVTVTRVTVSPDLHDAYVYVSVLPQKYQKRTINGLRHAIGHVHTLVCREVSMRTVPRLEFRLDESLKRQARVLSAIRRGSERLAAGGTGPSPVEAAPGNQGEPPTEETTP